MNTYAEADNPFPAEALESAPAVPVKGELSISFFGLVLFAIGYFNRPEDWFPGGRYLPFAMVGGILAIGGLALYLVSGGKLHRNREVRLLMVFLGWFILTIPFAEWKGGAFQIVKDNISKILILTVVIMNAVSTLSRLRILLAVQVLSIAVMAWVAHGHLDRTGRATGTGTAFGNSNDIAVIICITLPMMFYFGVSSHSVIKRLFFAAVSLVLLYTLFLTYSRTGFLALAVAAMVCAWHFGVKRGHTGRVAAGAVLFIVAFLIFAPKDYGKLIQSIYDPSVEEAGRVRQDAGGSREARKELMQRSLDVTLQHPIFGVGPNGFEHISGSWHVSHNTYLQLSSEAGLPALLMFLLLIKYTYSNLKKTELLVEPGSELWKLAGTLRASLFALLVGAFFTNFAYTFFPYFIIAFAAAVHEMALKQAATQEPAPALPA